MNPLRRNRRSAGESGPASPAEAVVLAAGGLVVRDGSNGRLETALIHRPRYDDWTLPKGKLLPGETHEEAAIREVEEETGYRCSLSRFIASISYLDRSGRTKTVKYWLMEPIEGRFRPTEEVDELRWESLSQAQESLTYDHDRDLVLDLLDIPESRRATTSVYLIRHGKAGLRTGWSGPDELRPLSPRGRKQARRLVKSLDQFPIERVLSSPALRCVQTVEPTARARGLRVETCAALALDSDAAHALELIAKSKNAVLCSHREVLEAVLQALSAEEVPMQGEPQIPKGSVWALQVSGARLISGRPLPSVEGTESRENTGVSVRTR